MARLTELEQLWRGASDVGYRDFLGPLTGKFSPACRDSLTHKNSWEELIRKVDALLQTINDLRQIFLAADEKVGSLPAAKREPFFQTLADHFSLCEGRKVSPFSFRSVLSPVSLAKFSKCVVLDERVETSDMKAGSAALARLTSVIIDSSRQW